MPREGNPHEDFPVNPITWVPFPLGLANPCLEKQRGGNP